MNKKNYYGLFVFALLIFPFSVWADSNEAAFKQALEKANRGQSQQAIQELERLKGSMPRDARLSLSLGLLYQSTDQVDRAISELETAVSIESSVQGYYALGLLYESKWLKTEDAGMKMKAIGAWEQCLAKAPAGDSHRSAAERHLQQLRNNE